MEALGFEDEELHNAIDEQVVDLDNVGAAGETEVVENDPVGGVPKSDVEVVGGILLALVAGAKPVEFIAHQVPVSGS